MSGQRYGLTFHDSSIQWKLRGKSTIVINKIISVLPPSIWPAESFG